MAQIEFLFINKSCDSSSLSRSDAGERSSMCAHVRNHSRTRPKSRSSQEKLDLRETQSLATKALDTRPFWSESQGQYIPVESGVPNAAIIPSLYPEPTMFIPRTSQARELLHYFVHIYRPTTRFVEDLIVPINVGTNPVQKNVWPIQDILCCGMETNALLAAMAARIEDVEGAPQHGCDLVYANFAIQGVSEALRASNVKTARIIRAISFLAIAAWHQRHDEAFKIHMKAFKNIVDSIGGVQTLDTKEKSMVMKIDGISAAERLRPPIFPSIHFDDSQSSVQWSKLAKGTPRGPSLGKDLQHFATNFTTPLRTVIFDLIECVQMLLAERCESLPHLQPVEAGVARLETIRHRLLELELEGHPVQRAAQIATLIWMLMSFTDIGERRSIKLMAKALEDHLVCMGRESWKDLDPLYLWILSVGAMAAVDGSTTEAYLVLELRQVSTFNDNPMLNCLQDLVAFSRLFLYFEPTQITKLARLADQMFQ